MIRVPSPEFYCPAKTFKNRTIFRKKGFVVFKDNCSKIVLMSKMFYLIARFRGREQRKEGIGSIFCMIK